MLSKYNIIMCAKGTIGLDSPCMFATVMSVPGWLGKNILWRENSCYELFGFCNQDATPTIWYNEITGLPVQNRNIIQALDTIKVL